MSPAALGQCVKQAKAKGWNGGVMVWQVRPLPSPLLLACAVMSMSYPFVCSQYPHADAAWIRSAKGGAY